MQLGIQTVNKQTRLILLDIDLDQFITRGSNKFG